MEFKKIVYSAWAGSRAPPGVYNRHNALMGRSQSARISHPQQCQGCGWLGDSHRAHKPGNVGQVHTQSQSCRCHATSLPSHSYPAVTSARSLVMEAVLLRGLSTPD